MREATSLGRGEASASSISKPSISQTQAASNCIKTTEVPTEVPAVPSSPQEAETHVSEQCHAASCTNCESDVQLHKVLPLFDLNSFPE